MKIFNNFLTMMGFTNYQDFLGVELNLKLTGLLVFSFGTIGGFIESWSGISLYLWLFLTLASLFDIAFGIYANIVVLRKSFETKKFFRGIFKSFIVLFIIVITNILNLGVKDSNINPEILKTGFEYMTASIHYCFVMLISLYLLTGISENGAKIDIPVFTSLSKILKMRITKVESLGSGDPPN